MTWGEDPASIVGLVIAVICFVLIVGRPVWLSLRRTRDLLDEVEQECTALEAMARVHRQRVADEMKERGLDD